MKKFLIILLRQVNCLGVGLSGVKSIMSERDQKIAFQEIWENEAIYVVKVQKVKQGLEVSWG